jgi:hypothetical protein
MIALFVLMSGSALFHSCSMDLKPISNLTGRSRHKWEPLLMSLKIVPLIVRIHQSDISGIEVTEDVPFNNSHHTKILFFCSCLTFLVIFDRILDILIGIEGTVEIWAMGDIRVTSASW